MSTELGWLDSANESLAFFPEQDHLPPVEEELRFCWLKDQQKDPPRHGVTRRTRLDDDMPGWQVTGTREKAWWVRARACADEYEATGRIPGPGDQTHSWLKTQRARARGKSTTTPLTPDRVAWLDEHVPGWLSRPPGGSDERWWSNAEQCKAFLHAHGHLPQPGEPGWQWIITQRRKSKGDHTWRVLTDDQRAWLDDNLPGWEFGPDIWARWARACRQFYVEHQRLPRRGEPTFGWLESQRRKARGNRKPTLTAEQYVWLDENLPGWSLARTPARPWAVRAHDCLVFYTENGHLPGKGVDSGRWLVRQREAARGRGYRPTLTEERRAWLDENLPGWISEVTPGSDEAWHSHAEQVLAFSHEHGRVPRRREPGGRWLSEQRQRARGRGEGPPLTEDRRAWLDANLPGWLPPAARSGCD